ncbi:MAG: hypothetical protein HC916_07605 [Coleofasciculaceae cyanobacterium SM2_1_6]|nr:hypothetical protein [Coleofasciculaceae cyanobacterium SM2_1_6]
MTAFVCLCLVVSLSGCQQKIPDVLASPPGDWVAIRGEGVALSLPRGFVGGNPGRELAEIQAQLGAIDPDSEKKFRAVSQNPTAVALVAFDTQGSQAPKIPMTTNVNITSQSLPKDAEAQALLAMGAKQIMTSSSDSLGSYQILQQQVVTLQEREIVKIIATIAISEPRAKIDVNSGSGDNPANNPANNPAANPVTNSTTTSATTGANTIVTSTASATTLGKTPETGQNQQIQQLFYLVPDAAHKKLWVITYTTLVQDFDRSLPIFEKSINTLQILS